MQTIFISVTDEENKSQLTVDGNLSLLVRILESLIVEQDKERRITHKLNNEQLQTKTGFPAGQGGE